MGVHLYDFEDSAHCSENSIDRREARSIGEIESVEDSHAQGVVASNILWFRCFRLSSSLVWHGTKLLWLGERGGACISRKVPSSNKYEATAPARPES